MEMTPERLQEIKDGLDEWIGDLNCGTPPEPRILEDMQELIAAVEAAQAEVAATTENRDWWRNASTYWHEQSRVKYDQVEGLRQDNKHLRDKLTDLQLRYDNQREDCIDYVKDIADLREQLAEERKWTIKYREAIIEDKAMANHMAALRAEVERLQTENELYAKHIDVLSPEKNDP